MNHRHRSGVVVLAAGLGMACWALADGPGDTLPPDVFERLVTQDAKYIQATLVKNKIDKKTARKVKATALMIAQYAQINMNGSNAKEMATLRDTALKLLQAVESKNVAEAKKLAEALKPDIPAAAAKTDKVPLSPHLEFEYVMRQFSGERIGGFGLEKELEDLVDIKGPVAGEKQQKVIDIAHKIATIGSLAQIYPPEKDEGKKTKKAWAVLAKQMREQALALAETARMGKEVSIAANALSASCTRCHDVFR
jgi:hypothetical protein